LPSTPVALAGWDTWVTALVQRYANATDEFEIWNEPEVGRLAVSEFAAFTDRTARVIAAAAPGANIIFGVLAGADVGYGSQLVAALSSLGTLPLLSLLSFHPYSYNPDDSYSAVSQLRAMVHNAGPHLDVMQGENGAPSVPFTYGALGDYNWTQCSQAKWFTRRLVADLGHAIPRTNAFTAVDLCYVVDGKVDVNTKGMIAVNCSDGMAVLGPKLSFATMQHLTAVFDSTAVAAPAGQVNLTLTPGNGLVAYPFTRADSGVLLVGVWNASAAPVNADQTSTILIAMGVMGGSGGWTAATAADLVTGNVYALPAPVTSSHGGVGGFVGVNAVPVSDFAVVVCLGWQADGSDCGW